MKAVVFGGVGDIGLEEVTDPRWRAAFDRWAEEWTKVGIISGG